MLLLAAPTYSDCHNRSAADWTCHLKVSILLGDREQHMLTILNAFKATNEQVECQCVIAASWHHAQNQLRCSS